MRWIAASIILAMSVAPGCAPDVAFNERVLRQTTPVRLAGDPAQPSLRAQLPPGLRIGIVTDHRNSDSHLMIAGSLGMNSGSPIRIPFAADSHPRIVLWRDLDRLVPAIQWHDTSDPRSAAPGLRMEVRLVAAHTMERDDLIKSTQVVGHFIINLRVENVGTNETLWSSRIAGEVAESPFYITSEHAEKALNSAYHKAMARLIATMESEAFARAIRPPAVPRPPDPPDLRLGPIEPRL